MQTPPSKPRTPEWDGLRGLAILGVMTFHFLWFPRIHGLPFATDSPVSRLILALCDSAWTGVDLFFVLSGFLITGILADSRGRPGYFRIFYIRRALRIFPLYYLVLGLMAVSGLAGQPLELLSLATYTGNFLLAARGWNALTEHASHFWTLAVEEQFYLFWPILVRWLRPRHLMALCLTLIAACPLLRLEFSPDLGLGAYVLTPLRADAFAAGALLSLLFRAKIPNRALLWICGLTFLASLVPLAWSWKNGWRSEDPSTLSFGLSGFALFYASLIGMVTLRQGWAAGLFRARVLRLLGKYSYCLYLIHQPICLILLLGNWTTSVMALVPDWPAAQIAVIIGVPLLTSAFIGWLSWRLIERPILKLKRRFSHDDFEKVTENSAPNAAAA